MNGYALLLALLVILIPNAVFATALVWMDVRTTRRGDRYLDFVFGTIAIVLLLAVLGIAGYIETEGL